MLNIKYKTILKKMEAVYSINFHQELQEDQSVIHLKGEQNYKLVIFQSKSTM
jgi:hypothetical protein